MQTTTAAFPWTEILSGGAGALAIAICWMFLRFLKEQRDVDMASDTRKDETIEKISADFSQTVRAVSNDVKQGIEKLNETTTVLLVDSRQREERLHNLIRENIIDRQAKST